MTPHQYTQLLSEFEQGLRDRNLIRTFYCSLYDKNRIPFFSPETFDIHIGFNNYNIANTIRNVPIYFLPFIDVSRSRDSTHLYYHMSLSHSTYSLIEHMRYDLEWARKELKCYLSRVDKVLQVELGLETEISKKREFSLMV